MQTSYGVAQVIAQRQSRVHQATASYLSGLKEEWEDGPNAIVSSANESKYHQPREKTITEALKIVRTDSSSPECLHFFEYPDIVASFRDNCTIRKFSTKKLFDRERSKGRFECFAKDKDHRNSSTFKGWKDK